MNETGVVLDIARFSLHDGPGIRTVVFLKGCPLRCVWCHNPEAQNPRPEALVSPEKCIGCGECRQGCPRHARRGEPGQPFLRRDLCDGCGKCAEFCFSGALAPAGRRRTVSDVLREAALDRAYYGENGGITVSGGEPLFQPDFTAMLLKGAKERGWTTTLETCGMADPEILTRMIPWTDHWRFDIKAVDEEKHRRFTGGSNELILANLRFLDSAGASVELCCPLIPGLNDSDSDLRAIRDLADSLEHRPRIHIEPFHPFGRDKLQKLDLPARENARVPEKSDIDRWNELLCTAQEDE